jgi:precorrin-6x reductase
MDILITMLNVGDGDAIIVKLTKNKKQFTILIDAGHPGYAQNVSPRWGKPRRS